jgi:hypothetical protein
MQKINQNQEKKDTMVKNNFYIFQNHKYVKMKPRTNHRIQIKFINHLVSFKLLAKPIVKFGNNINETHFISDNHQSIVIITNQSKTQIL